ncbi:MAG TPA: hypothetical protein G4N97_11315, partial [Thermoflexia bacterium]|nr:hypothetical protein [Thermoflexia bacterium]
PDRTTIANEWTYENWLYVNWDALRAASHQRYVLTDDFYGVRPGEELYCRDYVWLPSLAVGRLVETPDEILGMINGYLNENTLDAQTALAAGYDFFADCATALRDTFDGQALTIDTLISNSWDADDLRAAWPNPGPDLALIGAHFQHWRAFPPNDAAGSLLSTDIVNATADMSGTVGFSIGCHSGLNVPDGDVTNPATDPDFPQALARRGGYWVGNTGYGYGVDDAVDASERLMLLFAQELGREPNVAVGQALVQAKQRYLGSTPAGGLSTFHEKAMHGATLYGLPMYRVDVPTYVTPSLPVSYTISPPQSLGGGLEAVTVTLQPTLSQHVHSAGVFYSVGGEVQASPGRPLQPRASVPLDSTPDVPHGAMLVGGEFEDQSGFDPYVTQPLTATRLSRPKAEPNFDAPGWFPDLFFVVNRFGDRPRLAVVPGQFNRDGDVERLYSRMQLRVFYSDADDYAPPTIWRVTTETVEGGWEFDVQVTDPSGVYAVAVVYESSPWRVLYLTKDGISNHWRGTLTGVGERVRFFIQAVDKAGNVALETNKGLLFTLVRQEAPTQPVGGYTAGPWWEARPWSTRLPFLPLVLRRD